MYHSTDLLTVRGVAHLVVHGTSGSTSYETIPNVQSEISGDVLSTADMVVQRRDGPRRLREIDDDEIERRCLNLHRKFINNRFCACAVQMLLKMDVIFETICSTFKFQCGKSRRRERLLYTSLDISADQNALTRQSHQLQTWWELSTWGSRRVVYFLGQ